MVMPRISLHPQIAAKYRFRAFEVVQAPGKSFATVGRLLAGQHSIVSDCDLFRPHDATEGSLCEYGSRLVILEGPASFGLLRHAHMALFSSWGQVQDTSSDVAQTHPCRHRISKGVSAGTRRVR